MSLRHVSVFKCLQATLVVLKWKLFKLLLCCSYMCDRTQHKYLHIQKSNSFLSPSCFWAVRKYFCGMLKIFIVVPGSFFLLRRNCREITFWREWQKRGRRLSLERGQEAGGWRKQTGEGGQKCWCSVFWWRSWLWELCTWKPSCYQRWEVHSLIPPPAYSYFPWSESVLYWITHGNIRNSTKAVQADGCCKAWVYEHFPRSLSIFIISCVLSCCRSHVDHSPPIDADNLNWALLTCLPVALSPVHFCWVPNDFMSTIFMIFMVFLLPDLSIRSEAKMSVCT